MPSVVVGLLLVQVAFGAVPSLRSAEYNAAGCAASALMSEYLMDTTTVQNAMGDSLNNMECKDATESGSAVEVSSLWYCNESTLTMAMYLGDAACNESHRFMTMAFDCSREGEEGAWLDQWKSLSCNPTELSGRTSVPFNAYNKSDCSDTTPMMNGTMHVELGGCDARSDFSDDTNSWTPKSERVTQDGNGYKVETFGTTDCSGAVTKTLNFQCQTCGDMDPDPDDDNAASAMILLCDSTPVVTAQAFQRSVGVISVVLMLLSLRA